MKIAVFSDVHGNAVALEAVLADIKRREVEQVVFGGDLVFGGPAPEACAACIKDLGIPCVRGNTDEWFATGSAAQPEVLRDTLGRWVHDTLSSASMEFLRALPFEHRVDDLLIVHATPWSISDLIPKDADHGVLRRVLTEGRAGVLVYGHIHMGWIGQVPGMGLVVNTGSVGFPFDGDPRASYAVLSRGPAGWTAELHRVAYDLDRAAVFPPDHPAAARWATMMRTGRRL